MSARTLFCAAIRAYENMSYAHSVKRFFFQKQRFLGACPTQTKSALFANCRWQFLLDRLGSCLKLFVSTESTSSHEFASQFGLAIFCIREKRQIYGIWTHSKRKHEEWISYMTPLAIHPGIWHTWTEVNGCVHTLRQPGPPADEIGTARRMKPDEPTLIKHQFDVAKEMTGLILNGRWMCPEHLEVWRK